MKYLLSFSLLLAFTSLHGQQQIPPVICGNDLFSDMVRTHHPELQDAFDQTFDLARHSNQHRHSNAPLHVRVVVHVVWKHPAENLHDSVIYDQLRVLNEDYNRLNADTGNLRDIFKPVAASANIHFELAAIERVQTTRDFSVNLLSTNLLEEVKSTDTGGSDAWDTDTYLNIWVCKIQPVTIFGIEIAQILGFAFPPNGLPHWPDGVAAPSPEQDGVVIDFRVFGSNNPNTINVPGGSGELLSVRGRTPVHEVGHYLGLRHIWGDGGLLGPNDCNQSDGVEDTPFASAQSPFNCDHNRNTCDRIETYYNADVPDMVENYMDYSSESCMNMFSRGQVDIMRNVLLGPRSGLLADPSSVYPVQNDLTGCTLFPNPAYDMITVALHDASAVIRSLRVTGADGRVHAYASVGQHGGMPAAQIDIRHLPAGFYVVQADTGAGIFNTKLMIMR